MVTELDFAGTRPFMAQQIAIRRNAVPYHRHATHELLYVTEGNGEYCMGDHIGAFKAGDLFLIGPDLPHRFVCVPGGNASGTESCIQSTILHFRLDCLGNSFFELPENRKLRQLFSQPHTSMKIEGQHKREIVARMKALAGNRPGGSVLELLWIFSLLSESTPIGCDPTGLANGTQARLKGLMAYIDDRLDEKLSIREAAAHLHMSVATLSRFFKANTGMTVFQYIGKRRVQRACQLLADQRHSFAEVRQLAGFESASNFIQQFRRYMACVPREYRQRLARIRESGTM